MSTKINLVLSGDTLDQGRLKVNDALTSITAGLVSFGDLTSTGVITVTNLVTSGYGDDLVITAGLSAATISAGNLIIENPASAAWNKYVTSMTSISGYSIGWGSMSAESIIGFDYSTSALIVASASTLNALEIYGTCGVSGNAVIPVKMVSISSHHINIGNVPSGFVDEAFEVNTTNVKADTISANTLSTLTAKIHTIFFSDDTTQRSALSGATIPGFSSQSDLNFRAGVNPSQTRAINLITSGETRFYVTDDTVGNPLVSIGHKNPESALDIVGGLFIRDPDTNEVIFNFSPTAGDFLIRDAGFGVNLTLSAGDLARPVSMHLLGGSTCAAEIYFGSAGYADDYLTKQAFIKFDPTTSGLIIGISSTEDSFQYNSLQVLSSGQVAVSGAQFLSLSALTDGMTMTGLESDGYNVRLMPPSGDFNATTARSVLVGTYSPSFDLEPPVFIEGDVTTSGSYRDLENQMMAVSGDLYVVGGPQDASNPNGKVKVSNAIEFLRQHPSENRGIGWQRLNVGNTEANLFHPRYFGFETDDSDDALKLQSGGYFRAAWPSTGHLGMVLWPNETDSYSQIYSAVSGSLFAIRPATGDSAISGTYFDEDVPVTALTAMSNSGISRLLNIDWYDESATAFKPAFAVTTGGNVGIGLTTPLVPEYNDTGLLTAGNIGSILSVSGKVFAVSGYYATADPLGDTLGQARFSETLSGNFIDLGYIDAKEPAGPPSQLGVTILTTTSGNFRFQTADLVDGEYLNTVTRFMVGSAGGASFGGDRPSNIAVGDCQIYTTGSISAVESICAAVFYGDGSQLNNLPDAVGMDGGTITAEGDIIIDADHETAVYTPDGIGNFQIRISGDTKFQIPNRGTFGFNTTADDGFFHPGIVTIQDMPDMTQFADAPLSSSLRVQDSTCGVYFLVTTAGRGYIQGINHTYDYHNGGSIQSAILAGANANLTASSFSVIAGGSGANISKSDYSFIGGGHLNTISSSDFALVGVGENTVVSGSNFGTIAGGDTISLYEAEFGFIGGGYYSSVSSSPYSILVGGRSNNITGGTTNTLIGGRDNALSADGFGNANQDGDYRFLGGGRDSWITGSDYSVLVGGYHNGILTGSHSFIGGGAANQITGANYSVIVGGTGNAISAFPTGESYGAFIGAGLTNKITGDSVRSAIVGGSGNIIIESPHSFIGGGVDNVLSSTTTFNSILAGQSNTSSHHNTHIIGSNLSSYSANMTYVESLHSSGGIVAVSAGIGTNIPRYDIEISKTNGGALGFYRKEAVVSPGNILGTIYFAADGSGSTITENDTGAMIRAVASGDWTESGNDAPTNLEFYTQSNAAGDDGLVSPRMTVSADGIVHTPFGLSAGPVVADTVSANTLCAHLIYINSSGGGGGINDGAITATTLSTASLTADSITAGSISATAYHGLNDNIKIDGALVVSGDSEAPFEKYSLKVLSQGLSTSGAQPFIVLSGGNVGVGTTAPAEKLAVYAEDTASKIRIQKREIDGAQVADDVIGALEFWSNEDTYTPPAGSAGDPSLRAKIQAVVQDTSIGTSLQFFSGATNGAAAERMRITAAGSVGIGTNSPSASLDVSRADGIASGNYLARFINLETGGTTTHQHGVYISGGIDGATDTDLLRVDRSGTCNFLVRGDGNVGIGTESPDTLLDIEGAAAALTIQETTDNYVGAVLNLVNTKAGEAGDDGDYGGEIFFKVPDDGGTMFTAAKILGQARETQADGESGSLIMNVMHDAGTPAFTEMMGFRGGSEIGAVQGSIVFNGDIKDIDFDVRANGIANALFVQGSDGYVGIGTNTPQIELHVDSAAQSTAAALTYSVASGTIGNTNTLGVLYFGGKDNNNTLADGFNAASIQCDAEDAWDGSNRGTKLRFNTTTGTTPSTKMTILKGGNVGIGISDPSTNLEVGDTGTPVIATFRNDNSIDDTNIIGKFLFQGLDVAATNTRRTGASIEAVAAADWLDTDDYYQPTDLHFYTQDTATGVSSLAAPRMTIQDDGNVGIGTTNPASELHVSGSGTDDTGITISTSDKTAFLGYGGLSNKFAVDFAGPGIEFRSVDNSYVSRMIIDNGGNVGIGTNAPVGSTVNYDGGTLHINQASGAGSMGSQIHLTNAATGAAAGNGAHISMWFDDDLYITNQESDGKIKFASGGNADILTIADDGQVGIGTAAPASLLDITTVDATDMPVVTIRRGTPSSTASYEDGDGLGQIEFYAHDANTPAGQLCAKITVLAADEWNEGTTDAPSKMYFYTQSNGTSADALANPRMVIDDVGSVGIGVAAPQALLHVNDSTTTSAGSGILLLSNYDETFTDTTVLGQIQFGGTRNNTHWGVGAIITADAAEAWDTDSEYGTDLIFRTAGIGESSTSPRMSILSDGNVGIGTNAPVTPFDVNSTNGAYSTGAGIARFISKAATSGRIELWADNGDNTGDGWCFQSENNGDKLHFREANVNIAGMDGTTDSDWDTRMTIHGGKVGIGTDAPTTMLHVEETIDVAYAIDDFVTNSNALLQLENLSVTNTAFAAMAFRTGDGADMFFGSVQSQSPSTNDGAFVFANQNTTNTEMMRIESTGNVGIGTAAPTAKLHINGDGDSTETVLLKLTYDASPTDFGIMFAAEDLTNQAHITIDSSNTNDLRIESGASRAMRFFTSSNMDITSPSNERMVIQSDGVVGIGTATPETFLVAMTKANTDTTYDPNLEAEHHLVLHNSDGATDNPGRFAGIMFKINGLTGAASKATIHSEYMGVGDSDIGFATSIAGIESEAMRITHDGYVGIGTTSPDYKLEVEGTTKDIARTLSVKCTGLDGSDGGGFLQLSHDSDTALLSGLQMGRINFVAAEDASNTTFIGASIYAIAAGAWNDVDHGTDLIFATVAQLDADDAHAQARLVIKDSGFVGIGTAQPGNKLNILTTADEEGISIDNTANAGTLRSIDMYIDASGKGVIRKASAAGADNDLILNPTSGNVGIGTDAPGTLLHLSATSADGVIKVEAGSGAYEAAIQLEPDSGEDSADRWDLKAHEDNNFYITNTNSETNRLTILQGGNVGIGTASPTSLLHATGAAATAWGYSLTNTANDGHGLLVQGGGTSGTRYILQLKDVAGNNRMTVLDTGSVGIGTDAPDWLLTLKGLTTLGTGENILVLHNYEGGDLLTIGKDATDNSYLSLYNGSGTLTTAFDTNGNSFLNGGNVGIGTDSPQTKLHILGQGAANSIFFERTLSNGFGIYNSQVSTVETLKFAHTGDAFAADTDVKMVINESGNVGIGTDAPVSQLEVRGVDGTVGYAGTGGQIAITNANPNVGIEDILGSIIFQAPAEGDGAVSILPAAAIWSRAEEGFHASDNSSSLIFGTAGSEDVGAFHDSAIRMIIDDHGNVGIGTDAPDCENSGTLLHIAEIDGTNQGLLNITGGSGANDSYIGMVTFSDPTDTDERLAVITSRVRGSDTPTGGTLEFWTQKGGGIGLAPAIHIDEDQNVGIGNTTPNMSGNSAPDTIFTIGDGTAQHDEGVIELVGNSDGGSGTALGAIEFCDTSNEALHKNLAMIIGRTDTGHATQAGGRIDFMTKGDQSTTFQTAMTIDEDANVGIGTVAPAEELHVVGDIVATGNITSNYSDERLKKDIQTIPSPLDKIEQLRGVAYKYKEADEVDHPDYEPFRETDVGVLAQDVEKVLPDAVSIAPFDLNNDGSSKSGDNYLTVRYERIIPLLIESIKELKAEVADLKKKIDI